MSKPKKIAEPETAFISPAEIVANGALSKEEKRKALESWAFLIRSRLDALSEGMAAKPEGSYADDVALIREIEKAMEGLATPDEPRPLTKRTGGSAITP